MSLRKNDASIDLRAITDPSVDPLIEYGIEMRDLVDAIIGRNASKRDSALKALTAAAGPDFAVRAAAVTGNFEMMNRLLDGIGVGPSEISTKIAPKLGLEWPTPN